MKRTGLMLGLALVAQALRLNLTFVTADKAIRHYPGLVQLWAGA